MDTNITPHKVPGYAIVSVSLKKHGTTPGDASAAQMRALADIAREQARSPDALLYGALRGHDEGVLKSLASLAGVQMLGDWKLESTVNHRLLEVMLERGGGVYAYNGGAKKKFVE